MDEEASLRGRWDRASLLLLQESTKPCPKCSAPVERNGMSTGSSDTSDWSYLVSVCVVSPCRRLYAHAVSSVQGTMVLAVWSLLEQRVYGRPLVWLTHIAPSGRFGDNQHILVIISNWEIQRIVGDVVQHRITVYVDATATTVKLYNKSSDLIKC